MPSRSFFTSRISTSSRPSISVRCTCTLCDRGRRQVLADVVRLDRQFPVPAVDEDDQLNLARPAEIDQRVERRANRPAGVEHVVHQEDALVVDRERNLRLADERLRTDGRAHQIVAVQRDVEGAGRHLVARNVLDEFRDAPRQRHAARANADEGDFFETAVAFEDFVRDSREAAGHPVAHRGQLDIGHLFAASQGRVKERRGDYSIARARFQDGGILTPPHPAPAIAAISSIVGRDEGDRPLVRVRALEEIGAGVAVHVAADRQARGNTAASARRRRPTRAAAAAPRTTDAPYAIRNPSGALSWVPLNSGSPIVTSSSRLPNPSGSMP